MSKELKHKSSYEPKKVGIIFWCFGPCNSSPCEEKKETEKCRECKVRAWEYEDESDRVANDCSLYAEIKVDDKVALTIRSLDRGDMKMDLICPTCGSDKSGLLGCSHDFILDCPKCRKGFTGYMDQSYLVCVCGHKQCEHGVDPDADSSCEDQLIESGEFYTCQAEGCMCGDFEEEK